MTKPQSIVRRQWETLALECIANAEAYAGNPDPGLNQNGPIFATLANAVGEIRGWTDPRLQGWFDTAVGVRSASGGYGVGASLDGLPVDTDFLVTTSYFVAPRLAAGYDHGLVAQADMDVILDRVRLWPAFAFNWGISGQPGSLPDYSSTPAGGTTNQHTQDRIWNVVATAATFLLYNRDKHSTAAGRADCLAKGTAWKNGITWSLNRPNNVGGWVYRGVPGIAGIPATQPRQDGGHNAPCANMSAWLPSGSAAYMAQLANGITPGDIAAVSSGTAAGCYRAGAMAIMSQHADAVGARAASPTGRMSYADELIGQIDAAIADGSGSTDPGGWAVNALNCWLIQKLGDTL